MTHLIKSHTLQDKIADPGLEKDVALMQQQDSNLKVREWCRGGIPYLAWAG